MKNNRIESNNSIGGKSENILKPWYALRNLLSTNVLRS